MRIRTACTALTISAGALGFGGCGKQATSPARLTVKLPPRPPLLPEQSERRERTRRIVESERVPFNQYLPGLEIESETRIRSPRAIAERLVGLTVVAAIAQGAPKTLLDERLSPLDVRTVLTPDELEFYNNEAPSDRDRARFSWNIESAATLVWALGLGSPDLRRPEKECDVQEVYDLVIKSKLDGLEAAAKVRSARDILDSLDLIYCYHWAVRDEVQIHGRPVPGSLNPGVVEERHRALNWLTHYIDADWDDVTTDT